jgi:hypothetical protein
MTTPITAAPLAASVAFLSLQDKVTAYIATAKAAAAGGLTWAEFGELLLGLLRLSVTTLDSIEYMSGEEKKALVLEAAAALFDALADKAVPLAAWPVWILVRPAIRSLVLAIAAGAMEQVLRLVRYG